MIKMNMRIICSISGGKGIKINENQILGFSTDSRIVKKGEIYIGIEGEKLDGSAFYSDALKNGAMGAIISEKYAKKIGIENILGNNIVIVEDTLKTFQFIAKYIRSSVSLPVIGVTGSVGKTSTKEMISSVLNEKYRVLKTEGNYNNHLGVPITLTKYSNEEIFVIEMGMNHFGELNLLSNIVKPTICVITNIGTAHIGILGSRENILKAKLEILDGMPKDGIVVINNDNDLLHVWAKKNKKNYNIITCGIDNESDIKAYNIKEENDKITYDIDLNGKTYKIVLPFINKAFIYNSLIGIAVGISCNMKIDEIINGIQKSSKNNLRLKTIKVNNYLVIDDTYNASLDSMKSSLEYLKKIHGKRKIAVLGDMLELGEYSIPLHQKVGEEVFNNNIDVLLTVGKLGKEIAKKGKELGVKTVENFSLNDECIEYLKNNLKEGDCILCKASHSMRFSEIVDAISKKE